jgi:hypothetical protein
MGASDLEINSRANIVGIGALKTSNSKGGPKTTLKYGGGLCTSVKKPRKTVRIVEIDMDPPEMEDELPSVFNDFPTIDSQD